MSLVAPPPTPTQEVAHAGRPLPCSASLQFSVYPRWSDGSGSDPWDPGGCCGCPRGLVVPLRSPAPHTAHSDPDNVVLCLLAADEDDDRDVALQIHFTLIQAFCCENDINILRVSNPGRLAKLLLLETDASPGASEGAEQPPDLHCVLVTVREKETSCWSGLESWNTVSLG